MYPPVYLLHTTYVTRRDTHNLAHTYVADRLKLQSMCLEPISLAAHLSQDQCRDIVAFVLEDEVYNHRGIPRLHQRPQLRGRAIYPVSLPTGPLWGLPGRKSLVLRIISVSVPAQVVHLISAMSIAQHCQVALYHVMRFESRTPPNQLAAMSESSRGRSRTPPGNSAHSCANSDFSTGSTGRRTKSGGCQPEADHRLWWVPARRYTCLSAKAVRSEGMETCCKAS